MIDWVTAAILMIGAFGFGYGLATREARKDLEELEKSLNRSNLGEK